MKFTIAAYGAVLAIAVPIEFQTELAQLEARMDQNTSMMTLLPGQVEQAVAQKTEPEIEQAEQRTPAMEEYEHLNDKEQAKTAIEP